jgi:hypothetical protein
LHFLLSGEALLKFDTAWSWVLEEREGERDEGKRAPLSHDEFARERKSVKEKAAHNHTFTLRHLAAASTVEIVP